MSSDQSASPTTPTWRPPLDLAEKGAEKKKNERERKKRKERPPPPRKKTTNKKQKRKKKKPRLSQAVIVEFRTVSQSDSSLVSTT